MFERVLKGDYYNLANGDNVTYPSCTFWDTVNEEWDGSGCFVHDFDSDSVTCACTHLTTFRLSSEQFDPKVQTLSADDWSFRKRVLDLRMMEGMGIRRVQKRHRMFLRIRKSAANCLFRRDLEGTRIVH